MFTIKLKYLDWKSRPTSYMMYFTLKCCLYYVFIIHSSGQSKWWYRRNSIQRFSLTHQLTKCHWKLSIITVHNKTVKMIALNVMWLLKRISWLDSSTRLGYTNLLVPGKNNVWLLPNLTFYIRNKTAFLLKYIRFYVKVRDKIRRFLFLY